MNFPTPSARPFWALQQLGAIPLPTRNQRHGSLHLASATKAAADSSELPDQGRSPAPCRRRRRPACAARPGSSSRPRSPRAAARTSRTGKAVSSASARARSSASRKQRGIRRALVALVRVLLGLGLQDVHRAAIAREQVPPVLGGQEGAQRLAPAPRCAPGRRRRARRRRRPGRAACPPRAAAPSGGRRRRRAPRVSSERSSTARWADAVVVASAAVAALTASRSGRRTRLARTIRITPRAARRRPYGSRDPVGFSSIEKKPTSVSSLSARATATVTGAVGNRIVRPLRLVVVAHRVGDRVDLRLRKPVPPGRRQHQILDPRQRVFGAVLGDALVVVLGQRDRRAPGARSSRP